MSEDQPSSSPDDTSEESRISDIQKHDLLRQMHDREADYDTHERPSTIPVPRPGDVAEGHPAKRGDFPRPEGTTPSNP